MPLIVRAVNECFAPYRPGIPVLTVEALREEIKELDLWCSNCMVALSGDLPVAVCTGTKRDDEVQIYRLGVRPGHERQGHGGHILTSLSQKLAVLGPERLVVEVPDREDLAAFFAATAYRQEVPLRTWVRTAPPSRQVPPELLAEVGYGDVAATGLLESDAEACLERSAKTLANRRELLRGLALVGPESLEAFVLYSTLDASPDSTTEIRIAAWGCADADRRELLLGLLLDALAASSGDPAPSLVLPRLAPGEGAPKLLEALGFGLARSYHRWSAQATPL